jgi:hypothetical protein
MKYNAGYIPCWHLRGSLQEVRQGGLWKFEIIPTLIPLWIRSSHLGRAESVSRGREMGCNVTFETCNWWLEDRIEIRGNFPLWRSRNILGVHKNHKY